MSVNCNSVETCTMFLDAETLLKSLFYRHKTNTNCFYFSIDFEEINEEDCGDYESALTCAGHLTLDELLQRTVSINECGFPVFKVFGFRR